MRWMGKSQTLGNAPKIEGGSTLDSGLELKFKPSLSDSAETRYAPFSDARICDVSTYEDFNDFLPSEIRLIEPPVMGRNSFGYALEGKGVLSGQIFYDRLMSEGYRDTRSLRSLNSGDVVVYSGRKDPFEPGAFITAGVCLGNGKARSLWVADGPVVEHPIDEILQKWDLVEGKAIERRLYKIGFSKR